MQLIEGATPTQCRTYCLDCAVAAALLDSVRLKVSSESLSKRGHYECNTSPHLPSYTCTCTARHAAHTVTSAQAFYKHKHTTHTHTHTHPHTYTHISTCTVYIYLNCGSPLWLRIESHSPNGPLGGVWLKVNTGHYC